HHVLATCYRVESLGLVAVDAVDPAMLQCSAQVLRQRLRQRCVPRLTCRLGETAGDAVVVALAQFGGQEVGVAIGGQGGVFVRQRKGQRLGQGGRRHGAASCV